METNSWGQGLRQCTQKAPEWDDTDRHTHFVVSFFVSLLFSAWLFSASETDCLERLISKNWWYRVKRKLEFRLRRDSIYLPTSARRPANSYTGENYTDVIFIFCKKILQCSVTSKHIFKSINTFVSSPAVTASTILFSVLVILCYRTRRMKPTWGIMHSKWCTAASSPIHTADETKLSSLVASAVCTRIRNWLATVSSCR